MTTKIIMLIIIALLLVFDYALVIIAHEDNEQAQRMYRKWKDQIYDIGDCVICKHVGTDKCDKCFCGTEWERRNYERSNSKADK